LADFEVIFGGCLHIHFVYRLRDDTCTHKGPQLGADDHRKYFDPQFIRGVRRDVAVSHSGHSLESQIPGYYVNFGGMNGVGFVFRFGDSVEQSLPGGNAVSLVAAGRPDLYARENVAEHDENHAVQHDVLCIAFYERINTRTQIFFVLHDSHYFDCSEQLQELGLPLES